MSKIESILLRNGIERGREAGASAYEQWGRTYPARAAREHAWYEIQLWEEGMMVRQKVMQPECCD